MRKKNIVISSELLQTLLTKSGHYMFKRNCIINDFNNYKNQEESYE